MVRALRDIYDAEYAVLRAHSASCRRQYEMTLARWATQLGREPTTEDLDSLVVQTYLAWRGTTGVSRATVRKDRNQIVALWTHAAKRRLVHEFPTVAPVRAPGRIPRGYTADDVSRLLREARRPRPPLRGTPVAPHRFFPSLIRCCWETAERIGPHLALRWGQVDAANRMILFAAESRKGATRDIVRPISVDLARWLEEMRRPDAELVWPWMLHKSVLWHHYASLCKRAGVVNRGFHGLRKSAASYVAAAGGDATQLLDHSNPAVTKRHYLDETIARPRQTAIDLLPRLDLGEGDDDATVLLD